MSCNQNPYPRNTASQVSSDIPASDPSSTDEIILVVADAPEKFPQKHGDTSLPLLSGAESVTDPTNLNADTYTLFKAEIPLSTSTRRARVFIWEQSYLSSSAYVSLVASLSNNASLTISNFRAESKTEIYAESPDGGGLCLAKAQLYGTLDSASPVNSAIDSTEKVVWRETIAASGGFLGAIIEFDVTASTSTTLQMRVTVGSSTSVPGAWSDPVAWPRNWAADPAHPGQYIYVVHSRGWWQYATITMPAGNLDVKPGTGGAPSLEVTVYPSAHTQPERISSSFAHQSADTYGTSDGNKGCWGAKLNYEFTLTNVNGGATYGVKVAALCRGTGSPWYGAMHIEEPSGWPELGLPAISNNGTYQIATLTVKADGSPKHVWVPPNQTVTLRVAVVNGGGCTLPVNLKLTGAVTYNPNE